MSNEVVSKRKNMTDSQFKKFLVDGAASGLSLKAWCEKQDVNYGTVVQRRAKIQKAIDARNVERASEGLDPIAMPKFAHVGGAHKKDYASAFVNA